MLFATSGCPRYASARVGELFIAGQCRACYSARLPGFADQDLGCSWFGPRRLDEALDRRQKTGGQCLPGGFAVRQAWIV